jgi:hypothetical protein
MNIYHLSQELVTGYDTYSDCVVIAETRESAQLMHPSGRPLTNSGREPCYSDWPKARDASSIEVTYLGPSHETEARVVCSSFHAG